MNRDWMTANVGMEEIGERVGSVFFPSAMS